MAYFSQHIDAPYYNAIEVRHWTKEQWVMATCHYSSFGDWFALIMHTLVL